MFRVCEELPPRHSLGADSSNVTDAPDSLAINAAHKAALPPPITSTSVKINLFIYCWCTKSNFTIEFATTSSSPKSTLPFKT